MKYGNRFLDSNAHRCLISARRSFGQCIRELVAAFRWQFIRRVKR